MQPCGDRGACKKSPRFHGSERVLRNNRELAQEHTGDENLGPMCMQG